MVLNILILEKLTGNMIAQGFVACMTDSYILPQEFTPSMSALSCELCMLTKFFQLVAKSLRFYKLEIISKFFINDNIGKPQFFRGTKIIYHYGLMVLKNEKYVFDLFEGADLVEYIPKL